MSNYKNIKIKEETYKRIIESKKGEDTTIDQAILDLLNKANEVKPEIQKVNIDKAPSNFKCKHGWFYNKPIKENGQVVDWEKITDCPMLMNDPSILNIPIEKQYRILTPNCTPEKCKVKELNDKREKKISDKTKGHSQGMTDEKRQKLMHSDYMDGIHGEGSYYIENPVTHRIEVIHDPTMRGYNSHPQAPKIGDLDKEIADFER